METTSVNSQQFEDVALITIYWNICCSPSAYQMNLEVLLSILTSWHSTTRSVTHFMVIILYNPIYFLTSLDMDQLLEFRMLLINFSLHDPQPELLL